MPWNRVLAGTAAGGVTALAALAGRYAAGVSRAGRAWPLQVEAKLGDLGEVDEVSILPLVERLVPEGSGLKGEPGVSYLVRAGGRQVLFDSGLSGGNPHPPWQPVSERDAELVLDEVGARGPRLVALSGHDSTPWTYGAFTRRFGGRYRTLCAGEELRITAAAA
jgi:hypothetical protein